MPEQPVCAPLQQAACKSVFITERGSGALVVDMRQSALITTRDHKHTEQSALRARAQQRPARALLAAHAVTVRCGGVGTCGTGAGPLRTEVASSTRSTVHIAPRCYCATRFCIPPCSRHGLAGVTEAMCSTVSAVSAASVTPELQLEVDKLRLRIEDHDYWYDGPLGS